jgi:hypothetical protein
VKLTISKELRKDEQALYMKGRKLCSHDAVWRILRYKTYPATNPGVKVNNKFILKALMC